jgi:hypothetical protein
MLGGLLTAAALLVVVAPAEQTLGQGIKSVYIHVALVWAGMAGLVVAGLIGIGVALSAREGFQRWGHTIGWVALASFLAGHIVSFIAARVNWGGIFLAEPRYQAALNVLVVAIAVQITNEWLPWMRVRGVLSALVAAYITWSITSTESVLHPENAARNSSSTAIQASFFGLFILACLAGAWIVWYIRRGEPA